MDARALNRHSYTGSGQHTFSTTNTATHQKKHPKQYGNICAKCDGGGGHARHAEVLWRRQCARPWYREFVSDELAINVMLARTQTKRNKRKSCMRIKRVCAHSVWVAAMASTHTHATAYFLTFLSNIYPLRGRVLKQRRAKNLGVLHKRQPTKKNNLAQTCRGVCACWWPNASRICS